MPNRLAAVVFQILVFAQALLLLTAAVLKGWLVVTDPFADLRTGYPLNILALAIVVEGVASIYLLFGRDRAFKWLILAGLFSLFGILSIARWLLGISGCGCLGAVEIPRWILPTIIAWTLVALVVLACHRAGRDLFQWRRAFLRIRPWYSNSSNAGIATGILLIALGFALFPWIRDVPAIQWWTGQPPLPGTRCDIGLLPVGQLTTVSIPWRNASDHPVVFVGSQTSCTCIGLTESRIALAPHQQINLTVQMRPRKPGRFHQRIVCFVNHPLQDRLTLDIVGQAF